MDCLNFKEIDSSLALTVYQVKMASVGKDQHLPNSMCSVQLLPQLDVDADADAVVEASEEELVVVVVASSSLTVETKHFVLEYPKGSPSPQIIDSNDAHRCWHRASHPLLVLGNKMQEIFASLLAYRATLALPAFGGNWRHCRNSHCQ